jgi:hypothetical protein
MLVAYNVHMPGKNTYIFRNLYILLHDASHPLILWAHVLTYSSEIHRIFEIYLLLGVHEALLDECLKLYFLVFLELFVWSA